MLDQIRSTQLITNAWSDEPWVVEGAAVRVSLACFGHQSEVKDDHVELDGAPAREIFSDLRSDQGSRQVDLTKASRLPENARTAFIGSQKNGPFEIPGKKAREWLKLPVNPNGRPNLDVIRPWCNGMDITRRPSDRWIVDFGCDVSENDAALFEVPFSHVVQDVKPTRIGLRRKWHREKWWLHGDPRPALRRAMEGKKRILLIPRVAKYRLFVWCATTTLPDSAVVAVARDDDTTFGILHSRFHGLWSLRMGTSLEDRPRYTPTTTFETFPFPQGLTPNIQSSDYANDARAIAIADAAERLNTLRETWLNPPDLVRREPEVVPGYPDRILPVDDKAAAILKKRTLTNLYNERPAWLDNAHRELDDAVAAAYGWPSDLDDDEILRRLFELNQERALES